MSDEYLLDKLIAEEQRLEAELQREGCIMGSEQFLMDGEHYWARVQLTQELIGPYNSAEERDRELAQAEAEAIDPAWVGDRRQREREA